MHTTEVPSENLKKNTEALNVASPDQIDHIQAPVLGEVQRQNQGDSFKIAIILEAFSLYNTCS